MQKLFNEFPPVGTDAWEEKILADLKGADYRKKLIRTTDEGIDIRPYYRAGDLENLEYLDQVAHLRLPGEAPNAWTVCQDIFPCDSTEAYREKIGQALRGGAGALRIHLDSVGDLSPAFLDGILREVVPGETDLHFSGVQNPEVLYDSLADLWMKKGATPDVLKGSLGVDPLGAMTRLGTGPDGLKNLAGLVQKVSATSPYLRTLVVHGPLIQNAGGTLVEELAYAMAMISDYLNLLNEQGFDPRTMCCYLQLNLAAGPDYFLEIAKIRAARVLWQKVSGAYGCTEGRRIHIHATTAEWNLSLYDPHVNMLRATSESMSAILGGADTLSVLPFDLPYGKSTEFSERIARNLQIILREEAYFDRVADPARGAYFIESLTDELASKAWDLFRETETSGGYQACFERGTVQKRVEESRQKKVERFASGKDRLLGTNAFPNFQETILGKLEDQQKAPDNAPFGSPGDRSGETGASFAPLPQFRITGEFEALRLETERSGNRPKVWLFKYGNPAWVTARAGFAGNFFACAGYEILDAAPPATLEAGIEAARKSKAEVVVLCSADETYADMGPAVRNALEKNVLVVVAGYPEDALETLRKAGIEDFIHVRSRLWDTLKNFNRRLLS
ncbi:MAG: methylmalonyl-CoA mutase family protein [Bacteroidales bacterium]